MSYIINSLESATTTKTIDLDFGTNQDIVDRNEHGAIGTITNSKNKFMKVDMAEISYHGLNNSGVIDWIAPVTDNVDKITLRLLTENPAFGQQPQTVHQIEFKPKVDWVSNAQDGDSLTFYIRIPVTFYMGENNQTAGKTVQVGAKLTFMADSATVTMDLV